MKRPTNLPAAAYLELLGRTAQQEGKTPTQFARENPRLIWQVVAEVQAHVVLGRKIQWN